MRLSSRSYPHPVVGNRDDVPGAAFQATVEMTTDKATVYLDVTVNCSSATINRLVKDEHARFVLHVECSNTLFRRAYEFKNSSHRCAIPADNLNDSVEVNVFARATRNISGYRVDKAHPDYGRAKFDIIKGDILAVGEGQVFQVESGFDSLGRIGSIMHVAPAPEEGDLPMTADFIGDKIVVYLSKKDFADYHYLKQYESLAVPLTTAIVVPVLIEALHELQRDDAEEDDDRRWVRVLRRRLDDLSLKLDGDPLTLVQEILELPVKRSLASARTVAEGAAV
jgi:hypothetical protein